MLGEFIGFLRSLTSSPLSLKKNQFSLTPTHHPFSITNNLKSSKNANKKHKLLLSCSNSCTIMKHIAKLGDAFGTPHKSEYWLFIHITKHFIKLDLGAKMVKN